MSVALLLSMSNTLLYTSQKANIFGGVKKIVFLICVIMIIIPHSGHSQIPLSMHLFILVIMVATTSFAYWLQGQPLGHAMPQAL